MRCLLTAAVLATAIASSAGMVQTNIPLPADKFRATQGATVTTGPGGELILSVIGVAAGAAEQCVDFAPFLTPPTPPPAITASGHLLLPPTNPQGQPNEGSAGVIIVPFDGPDCTGGQLPVITVPPSVRSGTTPYNTRVTVQAPLTQPPAAMKSLALVVIGSPLGGQVFQVTGGNLNLGVAAQPAGPDPVPEGRVLFPERLRVGTTHAGFFDIVNNGTRPTTGPMTLRATLSGGLEFRWPPFSDELVVQVSESIPPGARFEVLVYFNIRSPGPQIVELTVSGGGDVNPSNNIQRVLEFDVFPAVPDDLQRAAEEVARILAGR